jgi:hypothetical protein
MKRHVYYSGGFRGGPRGPRGPGPPLFAQNLPLNVSKTQDLRPKIREFFAILGGGPPVFGAGPPFSKFLDPPLYSYFKQVLKYLATGLKRPSGTNSPPAEASTQGLKYKTNTIPILMHQMRISTNGTQAEKVGNPKNCENYKRAEKTKYCAMKLSQIRRSISTAR